MPTAAAYRLQPTVSARAESFVLVDNARAQFSNASELCESWLISWTQKRFPPDTTDTVTF
jgi:hypothetical protein